MNEAEKMIAKHEAKRNRPLLLKSQFNRITFDKNGHPKTYKTAKNEYNIVYGEDFKLNDQGQLICCACGKATGVMIFRNMICCFGCDSRS